MTAQPKNSDVVDTSMAALAESVGSIVDADDEQAAALAETFEQFREHLLAKSYAQGDEATGLIAEPRHVDNDGDGDADADDRKNTSYAEKVEAFLAAASKNPRVLARYLAIQERLHKSEDTPTMPINLAEVVKNHGVVALCKYMVEQQSSFGATEHELVTLASEDAARRYPGSTPAMAFAKLYEESAVLRDAIEVAKASAFEDGCRDSPGNSRPRSPSPWPQRVPSASDGREENAVRRRSHAAHVDRNGCRRSGECARAVAADRS